MNRFRTPFALLFQLLLLQVSVLGGGMACAPEWLGSVAGAHAAGAHAAGAHAVGTHAADAHAGARHAADAGDGSVPNDAGAPSHCAAAAGCSAVVVPAPEVTRAAVAAVHESAAVDRVSPPRSTFRAPEPPPPRA